MISASHNPYNDNGIKFFGPDGYKLSDLIEKEIEELMQKDLTKYLAKSDEIGKATRIDDAVGRYIEFVKNTFPKARRLDGLKIVVDCANGAAYKVAPAALWELGAEVVTYGVEPDGFNINRNCGATVPFTMQASIVEHGADLGVALDGDADRVILADEKGNLVDGDQVMALIAKAWSESGRLAKPGVVATIMSNLGLEQYLRSLDLSLERFLGRRGRRPEEPLEAQIEVASHRHQQALKLGLADVQRALQLVAGAVEQRFTVYDPNFTAPWTGEMPWPSTDGRVYEYACHEGNYALGGIMRGARILEQDALAEGRSEN